MNKEEKGCCRGLKECNYQILISKAMLQECKGRKKNLCVAWFDLSQSFCQSALQLDNQILGVNSDQ